MKNKHIISIACLLIVFATSCNKTQQNARKFLKAGYWEVKEIKIDDDSEDDLPKWHIEDCKIYKESCYAEWILDDGGVSEFVWQFRDDGKTFEISNQSALDDDHNHDDDDGHDHDGDDAKYQCSALSGTYQVIELSKKEMIIESTETLGHSSKKVYIRLEKEDDDHDH